MSALRYRWTPIRSNRCPDLPLIKLLGPPVRAVILNRQGTASEMMAGA